MRIDITGQVFGRWTVLERCGTDTHRRSIWACECRCGAIKPVNGDSLRRGLSRSCGCLVLDMNQMNLLSKEELKLRRKVGTYKQSSKEKNRVWELPDEQARELLQADCYYCGVNNCLGIDRIDNKVGYTVDNSRPCCKICNYAKNTQTETEFFAWVARVSKKAGL